jgi:hypothetical protein
MEKLYAYQRNRRAKAGIGPSRRAGMINFRTQTSIREQNQFLRDLFQWVGFRTATVPFVSPLRTSPAIVLSITFEMSWVST